jgi:hypothetical protein
MKLTELLMPAGGSAHAHLLDNQWNFILFMVLIFVSLGIASVFALTWGLATLIGILCFMMALILVVLRWSSSMLNPLIFLVIVFVGIFFLMLGWAGVELTTVDLRVIPGMEQINTFFNR